MKNLKKVLSLVLALAMAFSLMTVAFAADASDFTDYDEITYTEAVDVMTAAGVFNGYDDGSSFNPTGTLTREQAAKIITYMLVGQDQADRLTTTIAPYSDVSADRWSAGAIAYCTNEGIIAGTGSGTFEPTRAVTGLEFAKMLLVALGYDATIQSLEGSSWAINTATLALGEPALDTELEDLSLSDDLTREQAAQMAFNAMQADIVEYDSQTSIDIDGTTVNIGNTSAQAVTTTRDWGANINDDGADGTSSDPYTVQFAEQYCRDLVLSETDETDAFGRPAVMWTYDGEEVGTYGDEADYTVILDDDYSSEAASADDFLEVMQDLTDNDDLELYTVGDTDDVNLYVNGNDMSGEDYSADAVLGTVVELFCDEDDSDVIIDVVAYNYTLYQIDEIDTDVTSSDERNGVSAYVNLSNGVTYDNTDVPGYSASTYEEDAYVAAIINDDDEIVDSFIPEVVTGNVTTRNTSDLYVTVSGERYYAVAATYDSSSLSDFVAISAVSTDADDTYALYLDRNGMVIGIEGVESAADIEDVYYVDVVWKETSTVAGNTSATSYYAQLVSMDGTISEIELETQDHDFISGNNDLSATDTSEPYESGYDDLAGLLVTISDDKETNSDRDNDEYNLTEWSNSNWEYETTTMASGAADLSRTSTRISTAAGTYRLNSSTVYIFLESTMDELDISVYTGGVSFAASDITGTGLVVITEDDSTVARYVLIQTDDAEQSAEYSEDVIFIASVDTETGDGYVSQTVYLPDGSEETWQIAEDESYEAGHYYTYDTDEDGYYVLDDADPMFEDADVTENVDWQEDNNEGVIIGAIFDDADYLYDNLLTVQFSSTNIYEIQDIDVSEAIFVDVRSDSKLDESGQYDRSVSSLSRLADLVDNSRIASATLSMNVSEDGAVTIFLTDATTA